MELALHEVLSLKIFSIFVYCERETKCKKRSYDKWHEQTKLKKKQKYEKLEKEKCA